MKKKVFTLLFALVAIATTAQAQVVLNETNFPDANFRAALASKFGISEGDEITAEKIAATTEFDFLGKKIADLTGIEHFTALITLNCTFNQLTSIDVSKNTALITLGLGGNQLTSLDVSKNTALKRLYCQSNQLTSLDVSKNTALENLSCDDNQLTSLDVSKNTALENLRCENNQLTSLDVSKNTALTTLYCEDNQLTSLDVSKNTALRDLRCYNNQLTSLNVSGCTKLIILYCQDNQLTSLNMSGCTKLTELDCENNQLTSLNVSGCTALKRSDFNFSNNPLTSLDVSGCTSLTSLNCSKIGLTSLNVSGCTALTWLWCYDNQLTALNVSGCTALTELYCYGNRLTSLDVSGCTALTELYCYGNRLTSLDVSNNTALTTLYCYSNQIKGEAMDALVASLPIVNKGSFCVIDTKDENEGNVCTKSQVAVAKGKGWTVYDYNGYLAVEYEGAANLGDAQHLLDELTAGANEVHIGYPIANALADYKSAIEEAAATFNSGFIDETELSIRLSRAIKNVKSVENTNYEPRTDVYYTITNGRGSIVYDPEKAETLDADGNEFLWHTTTLDKENPNHQWGIYKKGENYYLYNVGKVLFANMTQSGTYKGNNGDKHTWMFSDKPAKMQFDAGDEGWVPTPAVRIRGTITVMDENEEENEKTYAMSISPSYKGSVISYDEKGDGGVPMVFAIATTTQDKAVTAAIAELLGDTNSGLLLDTENFGDANFREALSGILNMNEGDEITEEIIEKTTTLDVSEKAISNLSGVEHFTALTTLYCHVNQIKNEEMTALIAALPDLSSNEAKGMMRAEETNPRTGALYALDFTDENEQNVCTEEHVAAANAKGWTVYCKTANGWQEYDGEMPTGIGASLNDNGQMINDSWYSVDGVKLQSEPKKKGLYIIKGKTVVK